MFSRKFACSLAAFSFLLSPFSKLTAQPDANNTPSVQADQMPYFIGCAKLPDGSVEKRNCSNQSLVNFIAKNLEVPPKVETAGMVYVHFTVDADGKPQDVAILRGLSDAQNAAALQVVRTLPSFEAAKLNGQAVSVQMTLPIRFAQKDESEFSNGFQLTWGNWSGVRVSRKTLLDGLATPIRVRDEAGNVLEINELLFEKQHGGKITEAQSNGTITDDMRAVVKKLRSSDSFTMTATVQKKGQFFYVAKSFTIE